MEEVQTNDKAKSIKIIIVGSSGVGKTCLISHYKYGKFLPSIPTTRGAYYVRIKKIIKDKKYNLNLWDTAGQEKFNSLTKIFTKNANIVILVYSIVDKLSFQSLNNWLSLVKESNGEDGYALGVAANKADLYKQSVVTDSQGQEYARKIKAIWKLTSAKMDDRGIEVLIDELLEIYLNIERNSTNPEYIKLNNSKRNKREGGCCKGKGGTNINDNNNVRDQRLNSKMSTITVDENVSKFKDEEDF